jgi:acyl-CoA reductase-like NAD-dependent aldehyde dehydrogenase
LKSATPVDAVIDAGSRVGPPTALLLMIATAPLGGREDVDRAVAAAQKAFADPKVWALQVLLLHRLKVR